MTRVATMGTSSCATIAIAGFKGDQVVIDKLYQETGESKEGEGLSVQEFYNQILYPVSQPLGHSREYPFTKLMEEIDKGSMKTKFCIATLNTTQATTEDGYWPKQLAKFGFELLTKTKNTIGQTCWVYTRNPNKVD